jgi:molybdate transport system ATP-binding protein
MTLEFDASLRLGTFAYEAVLGAREEILVLFGHSGAGKSVTLQAIAGLLKPDRGRISIDGRVVFDSAAGIDLPPQERQVGYVVQDLALFNHMTVRQNVAFGLPRGRPAARVDELLTLLGIEPLANRRPPSLSGGQQQRVALARALAREGRLLLLDEPFSALDESLRSSLRQELLRLRRDLGLTIVFVTHDLREAHLLADQLAVFDEGRLLQSGPRETVFRRPVSARVAALTGVANIMPARVRSQDSACTLLDLAGARLRCARYPGDQPLGPGDEVDVAIRAERVNLRRPGAAERVDNLIEAQIVDEFAYGSTHTLHFAPLRPGPPRLEVEIAARPYEVLDVAHRRQWLLELPAADLHLMPRQAAAPPPHTGGPTGPGSG